MKPLKTKISITLDWPILEEIQKLAEYEDRSVSSYINLILKAHLEQKRTARPDSGKAPTKFEKS